MVLFGGLFWAFPFLCRGVFNAITVQMFLGTIIVGHNNLKHSYTKMGKSKEGGAVGVVIAILVIRCAMCGSRQLFGTTHPSSHSEMVF